MKYIYRLIFILFFASCGIDKETVSTPSTSVSNAGELDTSFSGNGILTSHGSAGGNGNDEIYAVTKDTQNRIIAVGFSINGAGNSDIAVWRLDTSGALDSSFSGDGVFTHNSAAGGNGIDVAYAVVTGPSDEIYVTGTSMSAGGNFDMVVLKLLPGGTLDTSFNGSGIFSHNSAAGGNVHDQGNAIAIDKLGKVVVAGFSDQTATNRDMALWKLNANGTLDTSFDADGFLSTDSSLGGEDDIAHGLTVDSSNDLLVAGRADTPANSSDMIVWKYSAAGLLDTSFNGTGFFSQNSAAGGSNFDSAEDIVLDDTGSLFVAGYSRNAAANNDMVVWKLLSSGSLDINFDTNGYRTFDSSALVGGSSSDIGNSLILDSQGRIVVVGVANEDMASWRLLTSGALDTTFNTDGFFTHDSAAGGFDLDTARGVAEDSIGRLYIGGFSDSNSGNFDATFWRLR